MAQSKKSSAAVKNKPASGNSKAAAPKKEAPSSKTAAKKDDAVLRSAAARQRTAIILFASAVFLFCVALFEGQSAWLWLHNTLFGLFGVCAWALPLLLAVLCVIFSVNKPVGSMNSVFICAGVFVIILSGIVHVGFRDAEYINNSVFSAQVSDVWNYDSIVKSGGVMGVMVGASLAKLFGKVPAMITMILALFVTFMFFSGTTLITLYAALKKPVKKVGSIADERIEQGMKRREELAAERERRRAERESEKESVSGEKNEDGSFNPHIEIGPEPMPKVEFSGSDNYLPDFIYSENELPKQAAERRPQSKLDPPVIITSLPVDIEKAVSKPADIPISKKQKKSPADSAGKGKTGTVTAELEVPDPSIFEDEKRYRKPPISCLSVAPQNGEFGNANEIEQNSALLIKTLDSFGVRASIIDVFRGPSVTRYELVPAEGVKISKITNLADDIALRLAASGVRIEAPIPNKSAIGIEVPNKAKASVYIREIIDTDVFRRGSQKSLLNVALGKDITGNVICADLARMPHLLIAGTTGSGKSVCINSMIISLLFNADPDEVKLLMIDPKQVEFTVYSGIPHLLVPVVSDPRKASGALNWAVTEMLRRYKLFSEKNVRDITGYNKLADKTDGLERLSKIVIFIDELSDLMMVAQNEVEDAICRLAQMARAAGMHLVIATQRPSVDVITGVIKANIPSRIALSVSSQIDSRTIIDMAGAEKLLGYGDMLYNPVGMSKPVRVQGCFVSESEVESVVDFIKNQEESSYDEEIMDEIERRAVARKKNAAGAVPSEDGGEGSQTDEKLQKAIEVVVEAQMASTTLLQRRLSLGYARAARLIDELEERKIVGPFEGSKPRKVLITKQQWMEMCALSQDSLPEITDDVLTEAAADEDDDII